jgi:HAD superfamily phosphatase (TIGR01668 family)
LLLLNNALYPKTYLPAVVDIRIDWLISKGFKGVLFDLDNTIIKRDSDEFTPEVRQYLDELRTRGFAVGILSNSRSGRVRQLAAVLSLPAIENAGKPLARAFRLGLQMLGTKAEETVLVGDQIFTDVLGGNLAGLHTILVTPLPGKDFIGTRLFNRNLEKLIMKRLQESKGLVYGKLD